MKNKKPIFIVGFARGGSNIILNMIRSHPSVCSPVGETQEVFLGKATASKSDKFFRRLAYLPIVLAERRNIFSISDWRERNFISENSARRVDTILFKDLFRREENLKGPSEKYTAEEIKSSRLLCKNLNGLIYATRLINNIYPDATFIAFVRDPRAICEGHMRRNTYSAEVIANHCSNAMKAMINDSAGLPNYHLFKYEDVVANPEKSLDISDLDWVRMETKNIVGYQAAQDGKKLMWYRKNDFSQHLVRDANKNQIERLTVYQRTIIEDMCRDQMLALNYQ